MFEIRYIGPLYVKTFAERGLFIATYKLVIFHT